jgi:hypothetical protein
MILGYFRDGKIYENPDERIAAIDHTIDGPSDAD